MSSSVPHFDFIIAGGGIAGLSTAIALAKSEKSCLMLEKSAEIQSFGAGIQLGPNVLRVIDELGLRADVEPFLAYPEKVQLRDGPTGSLLNSIDLGLDFQVRYQSPYAVVHRGDLADVLYNYCANDTRVTVQTGMTVSSWDVDPDLIAVATACGQQFTADLLVGADGLWSETRKAVAGYKEPHFTGHVAFRALVDREVLSGEFLSNRSVNWMGRGAHLVHYPVAKGHKINLVAVCEGKQFDRNWNNQPNLKPLKTAFSGFDQQVKDAIDNIDNWRSWPLFDRNPSAAMVGDRLALVGDASHPMLPYLAQGAGMAIEDAFCLANSLAASETLESGLQCYQDRRAARIRRVVTQSRKLGNIYHARGLVRLGRNLVLRTKSQDSLLKRLDWLYGHNLKP